MYFFIVIMGLIKIHNEIYNKINCTKAITESKTFLNKNRFGLLSNK